MVFDTILHVVYYVVVYQVKSDGINYNFELPERCCIQNMM